VLFRGQISSDDASSLVLSCNDWVKWARQIHLRRIKFSHQTRLLSEKIYKNLQKFTKICKNLQKMTKIAQNWCVLDSD
jgi:hypothetical protein